MNSFKFIHAADIHLGKKLAYSGEPKGELQDIFKNAEQKALSRMVDLALEQEVDFIIIAGDLYDLESRSVKASRFFKNQCLRLKKNNVDIYVISGNHDPAGRKNEPFKPAANVKFFSSEEVELQEFYKKTELSARILGQSYRQRFEDRSMYNYYTAEDKSVFNIGILHTELNAESRRYVPVNKSQLLSKDEIHYWALGHIHQQQWLNEKPAVYYPGTIQGREITEVGDKGVILVEVEQNFNYNSSFIPLSELNYKKVVINLNNYKQLERVSDLERIIKDRFSEIKQKISKKNETRDYNLKAAVIRLIVKGRSNIHSYLENDREELEADLLGELRKNFGRSFPYIWAESIVFRTSYPLENIDDLKENNTLYKELDSLINDILEEKEPADELLSEWGRIWQGDQSAENRDNNRFYAESELKKEILDEAERIIISELVEDGD